MENERFYRSRPAPANEMARAGGGDTPSAYRPKGIWYVSGMKLHLHSDAGQRLFTGYGDDHVLINEQRFDSSLLLSAHGVEVAPWAGLAFEALTAAHFEWIALRKPDILLFGTGTRLRFPHPSLTHALVDARIGLEVMDIGALCRTYNILIGEGRNVGAAVLIECA